MTWGRNRKAGKRYPSGKLAQPEPEERAKDVIATAVEARERVYRLSDVEAHDPKAGDTIGRFYLTGEIDGGLYAAAVAYRNLVVDYHKAISALPIGISASRERGGYDASDGTDPAYVAWCKGARERYITIRDLILDSRIPLALFVLDRVVIEDMDLPEYRETLRQVLGVVAKGPTSKGT